MMKKLILTAVVSGMLSLGLGLFLGNNIASEEKANADSLQTARKNIVHLQTIVDSLKPLADTVKPMKKSIRETRIAIREIHASCVRYAKSVEKNPALSVFIEQWIDRRFTISFPDD